MTHAPPSPTGGTYAPPAAVADLGEPRRCPNCDTPAPDAYCAACGQSQTDLVRTSLREVLHDGVVELFDWDAKFMVTLRRLFGSPGLLTAEYLAGRRARYVRPVRLYLSASLLFFVAFSLSSGRGLVKIDGSAPTTPAVSDPAGNLTIGGDAGDGAIERFVEDRFARFATMSPREQVRFMVDGVQRNLPRAFFVLVPVFALLLAGLYRNRRLHYAEHLIFALHLHAFAFLLFTARQLVPDAMLVVVVPGVLLWFVGYLFLAMRRVYGGTPARTATRMLVLLPTYGVCLLLALGVAIMLTLAML